MVEPTCTLYITIRVTGKSYSQTIQQGISHVHQCSASRGTSTCARPQGRPTQQISISLSPQENHLEYHLKLDSIESTRQETTRHNNSVQSLTHTHHMGTFTPHRGTHHFISIQRGTTHPSHGNPHPTQRHTSSHLSRENNDTPIPWAHPTLGSFRV